MIIADYHVHSNFSNDSDASMESMIEKGISLGLKKICFTDHMDINYPKQFGLDFTLSHKDYFAKLEELTTIYQDKIEILKGIELGLVPSLSKEYNNLVQQYDYDFIIGSSHLLDGTDPYYPDYWQNHSEEEGYRSYFQTIIDNVNAFKDFDIYGHLDYIVRYGPSKNTNYSYSKYSDIIDQLLKAIIEAGKGIEVNTSGFKYGLGYFHPQTDVLIRYKELGGELITIGSDAHAPMHLGFEFNKTRNILLDLGFHYYATFKNRKLSLEKL